METIFDHNPTEEEMKSLFHFPREKSEYLKTVTKVGALTKLALLFKMRGDKKKSEEFIDKIEDPQDKFEANMLLAQLS